MTAWRVLVGVWAPKHWDLSLPALTQYTVPRVPAESVWIDKPRSRSSTPRPSTASPASPPSPAAPEGAGTSRESTPTPTRHRRPPSRRLVRHVLRARIEAAKALAALLVHLERAPEGRHVRASAHLARAHGGSVDPAPGACADAAAEGVGEVDALRGWRDAREVVAFLRGRGARIAQLRDKVAGEWAAQSSDAEVETTDVDSGVEDLVWVPSSSSLHLAS